MIASVLEEPGDDPEIPEEFVPACTCSDDKSAAMKLNHYYPRDRTGSKNMLLLGDGM